MSPLGVAHWKSKLVLKISCPPPRPEAKKSHLLRKWFFFGLRPGGWAWYFQHQFQFSMCYPKGAHSITHRWLQLPTFWAFWIQFLIFNVLPQGGSFDYPSEGSITHFLGILDSVLNFQCATPRGLIRLPIWGGNYSLFGHFGFSLKCSMCYPKGAHSLGHRRGQLLTFWAFWIQFKIFNVLPQGGSFVGSPLAAITHFWGILD